MAMKDEPKTGQEIEPVFVGGKFGSNKCPADSVALDKRECKAFANRDGIVWKRSLKTIKRPAGCFLKGGGSKKKKKAFFNEHPSGGNEKKAKPICKQSPTVTLPPPTPSPTTDAPTKAPTTQAPTATPTKDAPSECKTNSFKDPCVFPFTIMNQYGHLETFNSCTKAASEGVGPNGYFADRKHTWCATVTEEYNYGWEEGLIDFDYYYEHHAEKTLAKDWATKKDYCSPECPGYVTPAPTPPGLWSSLSEVARSVADRPVGSFLEPGA
jgi:hypothetical protein